jgi:hypothetical protein
MNTNSSGHVATPRAYGSDSLLLSVLQFRLGRLFALLCFDVILGCTWDSVLQNAPANQMMFKDYVVVGGLRFIPR